MNQAMHPSSSADGVSWNLRDLYHDVTDPRITHDLDEALRRARDFETAYRGKVLVEGGPPPALLRAALEELEGLSEQMDKPAVYASLLHAAKTDDPRHGALLSRTREQRTVINKHLIFFDLEWVKLPDQPAQALIDAPELARFRHYLQYKRVWRPYFLSEPEEKILDEKSVTGRAAFVRLFDETVSSMKFPYEHAGRTDWLSQQQVLAKLYDADRGVRQAAAAALTRGLQDNSRLLTFIFNTLVLDHKADGELRHYPHPMTPRNLANEISEEVVEALMAAAERHDGMVQRYYRLKSRLLGIEPLRDYDRYAPIFPDLPTCDWPRARTIVQESYQAF
ncbi:MAG: oligoendopeptidase, partial [Planctomycetes bacterium]|nr:oligoendopeptidase [Planctomycetota bacterium]